MVDLSLLVLLLGVLTTAVVILTAAAVLSAMELLRFFEAKISS